MGSVKPGKRSLNTTQKGVNLPNALCGGSQWFYRSLERKVAISANKKRTQAAPQAASGAVGGERRECACAGRAFSRARARVWAEEMGEGLKRHICARAREGRAVYGFRARFATARARVPFSPLTPPPTTSTCSASKT